MLKRHRVFRGWQSRSRLTIANAVTGHTAVRIGLGSEPNRSRSNVALGHFLCKTSFFNTGYLTAVFCAFSRRFPVGARTVSWSGEPTGGSRRTRTGRLRPHRDGGHRTEAGRRVVQRWGHVPEGSRDPTASTVKKTSGIYFWSHTVHCVCYPFETLVNISVFSPVYSRFSLLTWRAFHQMSSVVHTVWPLWTFLIQSVHDSESGNTNRGDETWTETSVDEEKRRRLREKTDSTSIIRLRADRRFDERGWITIAVKIYSMFLIYLILLTLKWTQLQILLITGHE